jgi:short-subunit dehydrogenase
MNVADSIAIVTGSSSGIGQSFTEQLLQKGATVYGLSRSIERMEAHKKQLGDTAERYISVPMDISNHDAIEDWVKQTFTDKNRYPDILINNAGLGYFDNVEDLALEKFEQMMQVNVSGVFYLTRHITPLMKANPVTCHIINIASVAALMGNPKISVYNATKYALRGFSDALFKELRYDGIKVSCFFPGSIATRFFDKIDEIDVHDRMMHPDEIAETLLFVLERSDNFLISELTMRPLQPKKP